MRCNKMFMIEKKDNTERMDAQQEVAIMESAIKCYGKEAQMIKTMEELGELTRAIARVLLWGEGKEEMRNLQEEMADVSIMLSQLELMFGDVSEIEEWKLRRLKERLEEDE